MRVLSLVVSALTVASALGLASVKTGTKIPAVNLDFGFPPQKVFLPEYTSDKKMLIIGLPGAFTPT
jgi:peroxiredoxin